MCFISLSTINSALQLNSPLYCAISSIMHPLCTPTQALAASFSSLPALTLLYSFLSYSHNSALHITLHPKYSPVTLLSSAHPATTCTYCAQLYKSLQPTSLACLYSISHIHYSCTPETDLPFISQSTKNDCPTTQLSFPQCTKQGYEFTVHTNIIGCS